MWTMKHVAVANKDLYSAKGCIGKKRREIRAIVRERWRHFAEWGIILFAEEDIVARAIQHKIARWKRTGDSRYNDPRYQKDWLTGR